MKTTLILTQKDTKGNVHYSHEINVTTLVDVDKLKFGQLVGRLTYEFFSKVIAIRACGNKGFNFTVPFDFTVKVDNQIICDTLNMDYELRAKIRMSSKKKGQNRFARMLSIMLYNSAPQFHDVKIDNFDLLNDQLTIEQEQLMKQVREFLDLPVTELIETESEIAEAQNKLTLDAQRLKDTQAFVEYFNNKHTNGNFMNLVRK